MAIVQTLPVSIEATPEAAAQLRTATRSPLPTHGTMGSVGSLIASRPCHDRSCQPAGAGGSFRVQDTLLRASPPDPLLHTLPPKKPCSATAHAYTNEVFHGEWLEAASPVSPCSDSDEARDEQAPSGGIRGPPPKLVPVSGKLEENVEKTLIRPMAFKPVVPKVRAAPGPASQGVRPGAAALSESQVSLTHLLGTTGADKPGSLSCRTSSHSGTLSDSGRNSLSSLPTYSTGCSQHTEPGNLTATPHSHPEPPGGYRPPAGPSNSDSGRSSSSKSTGSLSGRGRPSSESGSCGRSPLPGEEVLLVRELEDKLREREAELQQLRDSLDENEVAICQVYEEKQRRCEQELEGLRQRCAAQVRQAAQQAQRGQQVLQLQVLQLQQEKKQLQEDFAQLLQERELLERRCASFQREHTELGPRLEETKWEVCQKSGEISLLKQQLKESQAELAQRGTELLVLRAQLREARAELQAGEQQARGLQEAARLKALELEVCANELQRRKSEADLFRAKAGRLEQEVAGLRDAARGCCPQPSEGCPESGEELRGMAGLQRQLERLRAEVALERQRGQEQRDAFEQERSTWQGEKEKVIQYQKQLQLNYVQMYRRNRRLEQRLQHLRLQGEEPPTEPCETPGPDLPFEEITATEI
ncbi:leucine zipper putative tumor suppressor 2 [Coturnix japonica]|uniref:Leucine zipper tumor suppressor 2 n=1 Tax=Coturnix japonica TaxID=93934 RepID=A0A8C2U9B0_COTJA|nr:leucine zipper putative tumor suppressor 2 [Coturnix japonica]XP_015722553.1 leucine zipper putative tumor suppressor 2 [Coturnix japonica]XP_015722554.1 leucine zipper putative tumor suppressor 2 [Coturnix japonica]